MSNGQWNRPARRLREAHAHLHALGESLELVSLSGCTSVGACLDAVAAARRASEPGAWLRLSAARVEAWGERRWPTIEELDAASDGSPCVIMSFDHHAAAANAAAIEEAGLAAGDKVAPAGEVMKDARTGRATGLLMEHAAYKVWDSVPMPTQQQRRARVEAALAHLVNLGYDEVHDLNSQPWLGPVLAEIERAGKLSMRVTLFPPVTKLADEVAARGAWESDRLRLGGGKVFADGTLNSRTALLLHRYAEPLLGLPRGQAMHSPMAMEEFVRLADGLGVPLAVHAIGDCAVRMTLDAIERASPRTAGFRIEHCEIVDATDVPRFAKMGVVCSVQPCHLLSDIEALNRFVPHRLDRVLPLRDLIASGCRPGELLWFGSDVPIVGADPADSVQAAVERRRVGMGESEAVGLSQRISEGEAWGCFGGRSED